MKLTFVPTIKDYRAGLRLHYSQKLTRYIAHLFGLWILPLFFLLTSTPTIYNMLRKPDEYSGGFGWIILALAFSLTVPLLQYYGVNRQFKRLFPDQQTKGGVSIDIDDDRVVFAIPGISVGTYYWTGIINFAQDERITLLYTGKNRFVLFPTQELSVAQHSEFDNLVARHLLKRKP